MPIRPQPLQIFPIPLVDEIVPGDSLAEKLLSSCEHHKLSLLQGDIVVIKHKVVSKAEGQLIELAKIKPSRASQSWARRYSLDARVVEVALSQAKRIVRRKRGVLITETQHGFICANSGVDASNVNGGRHALLLPKNSDRSAARIHRELKKSLKLHIPIIISDSFGRPWREGLTEVAIGIAGMKPLHDYRGRRDPHGYKLQASIEAIADELACAAGLVCGKLSRTPACIIRGFAYHRGPGEVRALIRPRKMDLFR
jgi:coenzyme F420-0:L-glutamate ligase/coenzyme F420-1:gamma-L-glutamate ligase